MAFFDRYSDLCLARGYKPGSEMAAEVIGTTRATISKWRTSEQPPRADLLIAIADVYDTTIDFLLGRTDDPTDYTNPNSLSRIIKAQPELADGSKISVALKKALEQYESRPLILSLYAKMDDADRQRLEGFAQGLLVQAKYATRGDD